MKEKRVCPVCLKVEISRQAKQCKPCSNSLRAIRDGGNPLWLRNAKEKHICPGCLKKEIGIVSKFCKSCASKNRKGKFKYPKGSISKMGYKNPMWKGDDVSYTSLHEWVRNRLEKPPLCKCGEKPPYDLANISGEYKRRIKDFEWLCRSCHMISDGRMEKFIMMQKNSSWVDRMGA